MNDSVLGNREIEHTWLIEISIAKYFFLAIFDIIILKTVWIGVH